MGEKENGCHDSKCICGKPRKCGFCRFAKWALIVLGGVLALTVVAVLALPVWFCPVATGLANAIVPGRTKTEFKVEAISLNPYSGTFEVRNCRLGNPEGAPDPVAFSVATLRVQVATMSLFTKCIHIREILIDSPYVSYVDCKEGNNFDVIAKNATGGDAAQAKTEPKAETKTEPAPEKKDEGEPLRFRLDSFRLTGTRFKLSIMPALPIPPISISDIGNNEKGATFSEAVDTVWQKLQSAFTGGAGAANSLIQGLTSGLGSSASEAGNAAKSVGGAVQDGAKAVGDGAKNLFKGLGIGK